VPLRRRAADADRHTFELVDDGFGDELDLDEPLPASLSAPAPDGGPSRTHGTARADRSRAGVLLDLDGPDGPPATTDPAGDGPDGPAGAGAPAAVPRRRRGRALAVGAVAVALVLGGMVTVDAVTQRAEAERLRDAPGGLVSLTGAPELRWTVEVDLSSEPYVIVPGHLVVSDGDEVVGYDLDTGEESWRVPFDEPVACGTSAQWFMYGQADAQDTVVCVPAGPDVADPADREDVERLPATVLAADGSVLAEREVQAPSDPIDASVGAARWARGAPGPDGSVLWVGRAGDVPENDGETVELDPTTGDVDLAGRPADVAVALQDVATGDVRWTTVVPSSRIVRGSSYECVRWDYVTEGSVDVDGAADEATADLEQVWGYLSGGGVQLAGCGISATLGPDGARLDDPDVAGDAAVPYAGGYLRDPSAGSSFYGGGVGLYDESGEPVRSAILDADGDLVWEAPGMLVTPQATDGRSDLRFVTDGIRLTAYDGAGVELWEADTSGVADRVLVATADTVLVTTGAGLVGLDPSTGRARWTQEESTGSSMAEGLPSPGSVWQAFTDGRTAVLVGSDMAAGSNLVGVDLADGTVEWVDDGVVDSWGYTSVDGRLLRFGEGSVSGLG